jgi:hypothetical protein
VKVRKIYVSWRKGRGDRRRLIGVIERTIQEGITFRYLREGVELAKNEGFRDYPGFPVNFDIKYKEPNLDIFSLRLLPFDRPDYSKYIDFWEAKSIEDKFVLLALTQGILPTDNFEFLGLYNPDKNLKFVTDLSGLSHLELTKNSVQAGDSLIYEFEYNDHAFESKAIKVFKGDLHVGYIKNVHNHPFIKTSHKLSLKVKSIDQNGIIRQIFVLVQASQF